ncbi:MAG: hypothetical protein H6R15_2367 [Proteobacteria bacterium]|nr:hypothetical protein [Pseudomonadota bacterium]
MQLAIALGCGHEISREYLLLASPLAETAAAPSAGPSAERSVVPPSLPARSLRPRAQTSSAPEVAQRLPPRPVSKRSPSGGLSDRLLLSNGADVGEPSLRLATELMLSARDATTDAQRDILRLEFRMLSALNAQATTQLAAAEKLRNMEGTLEELQQRAADFSQRVEKTADASGSPELKSSEVVPSGGAVVGTPPAGRAVVPPASSPETASAISEWSFYGLVLGALLGLLAWFGWRKYQERPLDLPEHEGDREATPALVVDPRRDGEREEPGTVDLAVEPVPLGLPMAVDLELDGGVVAPSKKSGPKISSDSIDSVLSVSATTLDEHFEANPVMELADIMLSFGRVKGAAQALQEYIDHNPQEALQPWIRLMDVYRMAGMRNEFEAVSRNLNQNFNVEVQQWSATAGTASSLDLVLDEDAAQVVPPIPVAAKAECLEDMPRLMSTIVELWGGGDVVGYLYQLLRDNRGGQRVGFALPVVEEILFLIELKETSHRMEKEPVTS